jgi:YgiT-type zinc finger domain-containing protein
MKCVICSTGETAPGTATVTPTRGETTLIIKGVSFDVCDNCDEYYLSDAITGRVMDIATHAVASGAAVEIVRLAA